MPTLRVNFLPAKRLYASIAVAGTWTDISIEFKVQHFDHDHTGFNSHLALLHWSVILLRQQL